MDISQGRGQKSGLRKGGDGARAAEAQPGQQMPGRVSSKAFLRLRTRLTSTGSTSIFPHWKTQLQNLFISARYVCPFLPPSSSTAQKHGQAVTVLVRAWSPKSQVPGSLDQALTTHRSAFMTPKRKSRVVTGVALRVQGVGAVPGSN